jgi:hypothetical protein
MKFLPKSILVLLASALLSSICVPQAQAVPITGAVTFTGGVTFNSSLPTATTATAWSNTIVQDVDGDFAAGGLTHGTSATFAKPWVFINSTPKLWTAGGFSFDLDPGATVTHLQVIMNGKPIDFLTIAGTGTINSTNPAFDPTPGIFTFSTQTPSSRGIFSFSAGTEAPDGGSVVAMLGFALAGIESVRRRLRST